MTTATGPAVSTLTFTIADSNAGLPVIIDVFALLNGVVVDGGRLTFNAVPPAQPGFQQFNANNWNTIRRADLAKAIAEPGSLGLLVLGLVGLGTIRKLRRQT